MIEKGKISVIIPVYGVEAYLVRCIESVRSQTHKNLEIILIDDGSTDNCPNMCDEYARKDGRITVIHKENEGLGLTRNAGIAIATGEFVAFIDSDDWISEEHIEKLYNYAVLSSADVVIGSHTSVSSSGEENKRDVGLKERIYEQAEIISEIVLPLIGAMPDDPQDVLLSSSSCMNLYKMDLMSEYNIKFISERYAVAEDLYFNIDYFCKAKRIAVLNECGYFYFDNSESISRKYNPKRFERTLNFYSTVKERIEKYDLVDAAFQRMQRSFLMKVRVAIRHIVLSDMKLSRKLSEINEILKNKTVKIVLNSYPIESYGLMMKILSQCMKTENTVAVYMLMLLREKARNYVVLKHILKRAGVGK